MTRGAVALVLAAGMGERTGLPKPKAFVPIGETPILTLALRAVDRCPEVAGIVVAVPAGFEREARELIAASKPTRVVLGGETRQESVRLALASVPRDVAVVVCHDAARPLASPELFSRVLAAMEGAEGAVPVLPVPDTVKRVRGALVVGTEDREGLALAQTPQAFVASALRAAHERAAAEGRTFTDDAALLEWAGYRVRTVPGERSNFKVTTAEDLVLAEATLLARSRRGGGGHG